jgi:hypothetical protein
MHSSFPRAARTSVQIAGRPAARTASSARAAFAALVVSTTRCGTPARSREPGRNGRGWILGTIVIVGA